MTDDEPPHRDVPHDEDSFAGALGLTFAGVTLVAVFAVIAGLVLYAVIHWL
ncbi:MAG: hypothetical protein WDN03_03100 [Rhizomicrobium sp.]